jgi:hypothetical protein
VIQSLPFLFFERANFPTIEPVLDRLLENQKVIPLVVKGYDYKEASGQIARHRIPRRFPSVDIFDFAPALSSREARALIRETKAQLTPGAATLFLRPYWPEIIIARERVERALGNLANVFHPPAVVVPEDVHYIQGRLACLVMKPRQIPCWAILPPYYQVMSAYPHVGRRLADHYFVMNQRAARDLGVPRSKVTLAGNPYFFPLSSSGHSRGREIWFAAQGNAWDDIAISHLTNFARQNPRREVVIKLHPQSKGRPHSPRACPSNLRFVGAGHLRDYWPRIQCLIAVSSLSLYEAALRRIPGIRLRYGGGPDGFLLPDKHPGIQTVTDETQLHAALDRESVWRGDPRAFSLSPQTGVTRITAFIEGHLVT